jgi:hypothetical protein
MGKIQCFNIWITVAGQISLVLIIRHHNDDV